LSFLLEPWAVLDILDEVYLIGFGFVLFVLHAPLQFKWVLEYKRLISKYCRLLTRFTGTGLYLLFLGCLVYASLWNEDVSYFFAILFTFYICGLGAYILLIGATKTLKLDRVRKLVLAKTNEGESAKDFANGYASENRGQ